MCMCVRACVCECVNERSTDGFELGCDEQVGESERDKRDRQADRQRQGVWLERMKIGKCVRATSKVLRHRYKAQAQA